MVDISPKALEQRGSRIPGTRLPAATHARHVGGRGTPDREGARPRAPRRRSRSYRRSFVLDQGRLWASGTTDREDPTSPNDL